MIRALDKCCAFWYPDGAMWFNSFLWLVLKVKWKASNDQDPILVVTFTQNNKDRKSRYWTPGWVMGLLYNSIRWKFYWGGLNHSIIFTFTKIILEQRYLQMISPEIHFFLKYIWGRYKEYTTFCQQSNLRIYLSLYTENNTRIFLCMQFGFVKMRKKILGGRVFLKTPITLPNNYHSLPL